MELRVLRDLKVHTDPISTSERKYTARKVWTKSSATWDDGWFQLDEPRTSDRRRFFLSNSWTNGVFRNLSPRKQLLGSMGWSRIFFRWKYNNSSARWSGADNFLTLCDQQLMAAAGWVSTSAVNDIYSMTQCQRLKLMAAAGWQCQHLQLMTAAGW
jgi:hypothetical protein